MSGCATVVTKPCGESMVFSHRWDNLPLFERKKYHEGGCTEKVKLKFQENGMTPFKLHYVANNKTVRALYLPFL